jgi:hypothetical protein
MEGSSSPAIVSNKTLSRLQLDQILKVTADNFGESNNWVTSIVDLLKLLHHDRDILYRDDLAEALGVKASKSESKERNIALREALMEKLRENSRRIYSKLGA